VGTLAKALGGFGGIIPGTGEFIKHLRQASHYYDGASAPPSAAAGASLKALEIVQRDPGLRRQLRDNIQRVRTGLRKLGLAVEDWPTANVGVRVGDAANMRRIHAALKTKGLLVPYVAAYSGLGQEGLLRIAVCATHTPEMIERLLNELQLII
jgi:7-keto-8-aminopelargonate synthetase-like enzyme